MCNSSVRGSHVWCLHEVLFLRKERATKLPRSEKHCGSFDWPAKQATVRRRSSVQWSRSGELKHSFFGESRNFAPPKIAPQMEAALRWGIPGERGRNPSGGLHRKTLDRVAFRRICGRTLRFAAAVVRIGGEFDAHSCIGLLFLVASHVLTEATIVTLMLSAVCASVPTFPWVVAISLIGPCQQGGAEDDQRKSKQQQQQQWYIAAAVWIDVVSPSPQVISGLVHL